jgi:hypothetical protein
LALARLVVQYGRPRVLFMTGSELRIGEEDFLQISNELVLGMDFRVAVLTSGYWASSQRLLDEGICYLFKCGVCHVQLSVDAYHSRVSKELVNQLVSNLCDAGFSLSINETVKVGQSSDCESIDALAKLPASRKHCFTRNAVGRAALEENSLLSIQAPYHSCDFGKVLYLHDDSGLYLCSGPGSKLPQRCIGKILQGEVDIYSDRLDQVEKRVEEVVKSHSSLNCDHCRRCWDAFVSNQ